MRGLCIGTRQSAVQVDTSDTLLAMILRMLAQAQLSAQSTTYTQVWEAQPHANKGWEFIYLIAICRFIHKCFPAPLEMAHV